MVKNMGGIMTKHDFQMNGTEKGPQFNWRHGVYLALVLVSSFVLGHRPLLLGQQPQAPAGTPLYSVNAKYVNGVAPGYWPTAGSGLTLQLSAGTAYCGNPPAPVSYPGGSLTLAANATNYVYLDPANNCSPAAGTAAFAPGEIPIAKVATGASSITSVSDARTWFTPQPCAMGAAGALNCSALGANQNITLAPSGTGASVINNFQDKGGQVFNIKAYGAKGDGATNDSPAFQAAYNAAVAAGGGTVLVPTPASCYLLSTPINMTNPTSGPTANVIIRGTDSLHQAVASGAKGQICANTGGILFDVTGNGAITFTHLSVTAQSGVTNPSLVGIYAARNSSGAGAQGINVDFCNFNMPVHTSGTTYSFGLYLYGSEIDYDVDDWITADYPLVVTSENAFNVHSAFVTEATGKVSNVGSYFNDLELDSGGLGPAAYFNGTQNMTLTGHSFNYSGSSTYSSSLYQYALEIVNGNLSLYVNWRQELYPGFAYITESLFNSVLMGNDSPGPDPITHAVEFGDAASSITLDRFDIVDEYPSPSTNYYYDAISGSPTGVAVLDSDYFYCGNESNCANIPVGTYQPGGWSLYQADIHYTGSATNMHPVFKTTGSGIVSRFPNSTATISFGAGAPSGTCTTPSLYLRTDGGSGSTLYVCENSAWAAK